jgi:hypothetical protein
MAASAKGGGRGSSRAKSRKPSFKAGKAGDFGAPF